MRIVQIVPNWNKFLPQTAVGIRGVVRDLCLGLQEKGHDVTLIAPLGSEFPNIKIKTTTIDTASLGMSSRDYASLPYRLAYASQAVDLLGHADVVHSHLEHMLLPFTPFIKKPLVHTLHSIDYREEDKFLFREYRQYGTYVAISNRHRELISPFTAVTQVVYNGIDTELYRPENHPDGYLLWIGRYVPEKGADIAVELAKRTKIHTILAGFRNKAQGEYFDNLKKQEKSGFLELYQESLGEEKIKLLQKARAFLVPITWEEPFGLTMIEAMACGTPVVAYNRGSVSEIIRDGVTGFIIDPPEADLQMKNEKLKTKNESSWIIQKRGVEGLIEAVKRIDEIDRAACRRHVQANFTVEKMVEGYEKVYQKVISGKREA